MTSPCPHCHNQLQLTEAQQEKVNKALAALPEGKTLKISCPACKQPIHLRPDGTMVENGGTGAAAATAGKPAATASTSPGPRPVNLPPAAPAPPDLGWLQRDEEVADPEVVIKDEARAMVLMAEGQQREQVARALEGMDYKVEYPASAATAKERMRFVKFAVVVMHSGFEGGDAAGSSFHRHMRQMPMADRRLLLYILIGPEFRTLYDLEALAYSANLVVNESDVGKMELILKKALHDYHVLFGPYLEALREHGL